MSYLFTSESVSEGHPDKIADQISDAILDAMLAQDPNSRVACETFVTTGLVVVGGEVTTKAYVEIPDVVRSTIKRIGYKSDDYMFDADSCGIMVTLHSQSPDIAQGVDEGAGVDKEQGAGDQGMMFGYATQETEEYMPMALAFSHRLVQRLAEIRKNNPELMSYLRPDAKAQVTIEYDDQNQPIRVHTIVVSTQHDEFIKADSEHPEAQQAAENAMLDQIRADVIKHVIQEVIPEELLVDTIFHINPTGKFVIGGPHGDAGLTGRKIIVDTYGGKGAHGGGAFSGKDATKVDRSAAYAARHIAKNLVAAGVADELLVQVAYAIGVSKPVSLTVNTYGTANVGLSDSEIANKVQEIFDMRPKAIIERFGLRNPIFSKTAAYGHLGRKPFVEAVEVQNVTIREDEKAREEIRHKEQKEFEFFTWEKLDFVKKVKESFGL
ncbi:methionine adenosyltransferase [Xanthovirga aplysinae]|uniref:methionine adenosyltransferase n=1 Tax=Xanthovirga aplysinae TaxID=2529853 RepID=UPI0012BBFA70|nr:methionine adenosyltransferase [Xanthovirga aplysinae]MTI29483.1 methionine adenosyltransferase [Xanthovirga aplysinae]